MLLVVNADSCNDVKNCKPQINLYITCQMIHSDVRLMKYPMILIKQSMPVYQTINADALHADG